jgi:hypothetical protein
MFVRNHLVGMARMVTVGTLDDRMNGVWMIVVTTPLDLMFRHRRCKVSLVV